MKPYRPVYWFSGQFLDPQHLQQADCSQQSLAAINLAQSCPWFWGLAELALDDGLLQEDIIAVNKAQLRFQDGAWVQAAEKAQDGNAVIERRSFKEAWKDRDRPFMVYAGLSALQDKDNVAGLIPPAGPGGQISGPLQGRFLASGADELLADRYALPHPSRPDQSGPVRMLYYYVRLFWADELNAINQHHLFPLMRLSDKGRGTQVDCESNTPLIRLKAGLSLNKLVEKLAGRLLGLAKHLESSRPEDIFQDQVTPALLISQQAARLTAELSLWSGWDMAHPWAVFKALSGGLAAMRACSPGRRPPIPAYSHEAPLASFEALYQGFEDILNRLMPKVVSFLEFSPVNNLLVANIPKACQGESLRAYLSINTEEPIADILREGRLLAGSPAEVEKFLIHALAGLELTEVDAPPGLPTGKNLYYLAPDCNSEIWRNMIEKERWALMLITNEARPLEVMAKQVKAFFLRG